MRFKLFSVCLVVLVLFAGALYADVRRTAGDPTAGFRAVCAKRAEINIKQAIQLESLLNDVPDGFPQSHSSMMELVRQRIVAQRREAEFLMELAEAKWSMLERRGLLDLQDLNVSHFGFVNHFRSSVEIFTARKRR